MAIEYNRTMKIKYEHDERLDKKNEARLAQQLQNKGLNMMETYWSEVPEYGYTLITKKTTRYGIYMDDELVFDVHYLSTANEIVEGLSNKFDNVSTDKVVNETTKKDWVATSGCYLLPNFDEYSPFKPLYEDVTDKPSYLTLMKLKEIVK